MVPLVKFLKGEPDLHGFKNFLSGLFKFIPILQQVYFINPIF